MMDWDKDFNLMMVYITTTMLAIGMIKPGFNFYWITGTFMLLPITLTKILFYKNSK